MMNDKVTYTIGDLAREFGLTLRALRFYEDKGLLSPGRQGVNRIYSRRDRTRLKLVLLGKRIGFSLVEVRGLLDLYDLSSGKVKQPHVALRKFEAQLRYLREQQREVEQAIEELTRLRDETQTLLRQREAGEGGKAAYD
jgi:DNA-binding transcriptional MerR regulator